MAVKLEGFVDDGRGAPLPNISAIVTRVTDGGIVTSGLTGPDGRWHFSGLSESEEYLVNLADGAGNAIVRGPWSGQLREAWIRDRLALPDSGTAILPNGGNTLVGTLPLVLDPNPANVLEWGPAGIYSAGAVGLTEEAADLLYEPIDSAYTKAESDALYSPIDAVVDAWTKAESDARYEPLDTMYTKAESDARYPQKTDVDPYPSYLTAAEADALFLTPTEGNAAYATSAHNHDTTYVQLTGGSVMTGLLGPTSNNTRDLGTTALRWRKLWAVDAEFTNAPTVGGSALLTATAADTLFLTPTEGNAAYATSAHNHDTVYVQLGGGSVMTGLLGPTTTNTRDLGTTALRWRKLWAVDAEFTNVPTVGGTSLDSRYAATAHNHDASYVLLAGGSVMTGLLGPTTTNTRDLGTTALRWRKLWAVDGEFTNVPTVGGTSLDSRYSLAAHNHDASYVQLTGGSVMTGLLGPSTHNTRDLGTSGTRWRALYGMTGDFTTSLTVATKPITPSPDAANIIEFRANGLYAAAGAVTDIWVNTGGDTMTGTLNMTASVVPTANNTYSLGYVSAQWNTINTVLLRLSGDGSTTAPVGTNGAVRLRNGPNGNLAWRNAGDTADLTLGVDTSNNVSITSGVERLRIDSAGVVKINPLTDPALPAAYTGKPGLFVQQEGADLVAMNLVRASSNDPYAQVLAFSRSRGTFASKVAVASGDAIGQITMQAWSGANWLATATIQAAASGTVTTTAVPGTLSFNTADSAGTLVARLSIASDGAVTIANQLLTTKGLNASGGTVTASSMAMFKFYEFAADNWAGIGCGDNGRPWLRNGLTIYSNTGVNVITAYADGNIGIGGRATNATASLTTQALAPTGYSFVSVGPASAANTHVHFRVHNSADTVVVLGANNLGWVTDQISATAIGSYATKRIPVYNAGGTLQGYIPLYS